MAIKRKLCSPSLLLVGDPSLVRTALTTEAKPQLMKQQTVSVQNSNFCLNTDANHAEQAQPTLRCCTTTMPQ